MIIDNNKNILNGEINDYRSQHKQMRIFAYEEHRISRDILSVAYSIFKLEKLIRDQKLTNVKIGRFIDSGSNKLRQALTELISYVLLHKVNIEFYNLNKRFYERKYDKQESDNIKTIVLFSGGIDSLAGINWARKYFTNIAGLFCAHSDQTWAIHTTNRLANTILSDYDIDLKTIHVPRLEKGSYSQLRGFLYILAAGAWLDILSTDTIILSECGPTMHQPRFGPYDRVTMTTHPVVMEIAKRILETLLEKKIRIYTPFQNMTKAEVISSLPDNISITETHSCITQRLGRHDGTCYGCIIRSLGSLVANKKDVGYNRNPLIEENSNKDNLLSLLLFCQDILLDYNSMPLYQTENIELYQKYDLFRRFALDNFAAIHLLINQGIKPINEVCKIYDDYINKNGISELEKRIVDLKLRKFQINEKPIA